MWDQPRKRYLLSLVYAIIIGGKLSTCFKFMLKTETCGEGVMDSLNFVICSLALKASDDILIVSYTVETCMLLFADRQELRF